MLLKFSLVFRIKRVDLKYIINNMGERAFAGVLFFCSLTVNSQQTTINTHSKLIGATGSISESNPPT
jgi:hypothetical protein